MELDHLKNLWNEDDKNTPPEISLEEQKQIHSPLEMIRINMKTEFWLMIFTLPMLFSGFPSASGDYNIKMISTFQIILSVCFIVYFYSRFIKLYKLLGKKNINTNYDLFNLKTQLLVSKELYLSYYITYIPLAFVVCLIQIGFHFEEDYHIGIFVVSLLMCVLLVAIFIKYWIYYLYGRYINQVIYLIDELNGIDVELIIEKKRTWFERTQNFLMEKFGFRGNILNTVIWFFGMYFTFIAFMVIILLIILIVGTVCNLIDINEFNKAMQGLNT